MEHSSKNIHFLLRQRHHAGQKAMNFLALTLLGLKSSLHGCILRKNLSPVWGLDRSQIGDRLAIQQYIA